MSFTAKIVKLYEIHSKIVAVRVQTNEREMMFSKKKPPITTYDWMELKHWKNLDEFIILILRNNFDIKERKFNIDDNVEVTLTSWNCPANIKNTMGPSSDQPIDLTYECSVVYNGPPAQIIYYNQTSSVVTLPKLSKRLSKHFNVSNVKSINTEDCTPDEISRQLEEVNQPEEPPKIDQISLQTLTEEKILSSFHSFKPIFDEIFTRILDGVRTPKLVSFSERLVLDLISDEIKSKMADMIRANYSSKKENKLFVYIMVPEWILQLAMRKYRLEREETIRKLLAQAAEHQRENSTVQNA